MHTISSSFCKQKTFLSEQAGLSCSQKQHLSTKGQDLSQYQRTGKFWEVSWSFSCAFIAYLKMASDGTGQHPGMIWLLTYLLGWLYNLWHNILDVKFLEHSKVYINAKSYSNPGNGKWRKSIQDWCTVFMPYSWCTLAHATLPLKCAIMQI